MSDLKEVTHTLAEFKNNSDELARQIKTSGEPLILTIDGKPELAVCDLQSYRKFQGCLEEQASHEDLRRSIEQVNAGQGRLAEEVHEEIRRKYGFRN